MVMLRSTFEFMDEDHYLESISSVSLFSMLCYFVTKFIDLLKMTEYSAPLDLLFSSSF